LDWGKNYREAAQTLIQQGYSDLSAVRVSRFLGLNLQKRKRLLNYMLEEDKQGFFMYTMQNVHQPQIQKYKDIYTLTLTIIDLLYVKENEEQQVAHYTKKSTAQRLLIEEEQMEEKDMPKFRLSSIVTSNDPQEGKTLLYYLFGKGNSEFLQQETYSAFIGCFTFNHDNLNQFRLYGKDDGREGSGVSLALNSDFFDSKVHTAILLPRAMGIVDDKQSQVAASKEQEEEKHSLFRCLYLDPLTGYVASVGQREEYSFYRDNNSICKDIEQRKKDYEEYKKYIDGVLKDVRAALKDLKELIDRTEDLDTNVVSQLLLNLRYLTKHVAFKEEQECRIVTIRSLTDKYVHINDNFGQMYVDYLDMRRNVKQIWFGSKVTGMELFKNMLQHNGLGHIDCYRSTHPLG
jgi:hypothetical protein